MTLAVLLTCYNRKMTTVNCIEKLLPQLEELDLNYRFFICDDRSEDGTYERLQDMLPGHVVIQSNGKLFWCKGMYTVMKMAVEDSYDYYLMINDDVVFFENALETMFSSYYKVGKSCGIVGATKAINSENYTYGGRDKEEKIILPGEKGRECIWANWNCFLIDREIVENVGIIDGKYQHAWGDFDYSFRMHKKNYKIYVADKCVGRCDQNSTKGSYRDKTVKKTIRLKKLFAPKGAPFYSYMRYHIRTRGKCGILLYLYGYASMIGYICVGKELN